jgi:glutamate mutase epsilon subunit
MADMEESKDLQVVEEIVGAEEEVESVEMTQTQKPGEVEETIAVSAVAKHIIFGYLNIYKFKGELQFIFIFHQYLV